MDPHSAHDNSLKNKYFSANDDEERLFAQGKAVGCGEFFPNSSENHLKIFPLIISDQ